MGELMGENPEPKWLHDDADADDDGGGDDDDDDDDDEDDGDDDDDARDDDADLVYDFDNGAADDGAGGCG